MIPGIIAATLVLCATVLCATLLASPITLGGLSYVSSEPVRGFGGFTVTDQSEVPMPYGCDTTYGVATCSAVQPQTVQWIIDTSDRSAGIVRIAIPGRNG